MDYTLVILPEVTVNAEFDPDDYDLVNLTTLETNLAGFEPDALALPSEVQGGDAGTLSALIADLRNRKDAEIDSTNNNIDSLMVKRERLEQTREEVQDIYDVEHAFYEALSQIPANMRTPEQVDEYGRRQDNLDTLWKAFEEIDEKIDAIDTRIHELELYKTYVEATYAYMENNIQEINQSADPTDPPQYVYHVGATQLIIT